MPSAPLVPVLALLLSACGGSAPQAPDDGAAAPGGESPAQKTAVLERGPGEKGPLAVGDPLAWLDSEVREPAPEVAAWGARVESVEDADAPDPQALAALATELDAWLETHPDDVDARYWRGRVHLLQATPAPGVDAAATDAALAAAVQDLEAAVAADQDFLAARQFLSDAYVRSDRFEDALAQLDHMIEARPEVGLLYANRAFVRRKTGDGPGSARDVIQACDLGYLRACIGARMEKKRLEQLEAAAPGATPDGPPDPAPAAEADAPPTQETTP